jgi:hypothetical protein
MEAGGTNNSLTLVPESINQGILKLSLKPATTDVKPQIQVNIGESTKQREEDAASKQRQD